MNPYDMQANLCVICGDTETQDGGCARCDHEEVERIEALRREAAEEYNDTAYLYVARDE